MRPRLLHFSRDKFLPREWLDSVALSCFLILQEIFSIAEVETSERGIVFLPLQKWKCRGRLFYGLGLWICPLNSYRYWHDCMPHMPYSSCYMRSESKSRKVLLRIRILAFNHLLKRRLTTQNTVGWILLMMTYVLPCILLRNSFRLLKTNWCYKQSRHKRICFLALVEQAFVLWHRWWCKAKWTGMHCTPLSRENSLFLKVSFGNY